MCVWFSLHYNFVILTYILVCKLNIPGREMYLME